MLFPFAFYMVEVAKYFRPYDPSRLRENPGKASKLQ